MRSPFCNSSLRLLPGQAGLEFKDSGPLLGEELGIFPEGLHQFLPVRLELLTVSLGQP
jgi:hypothetical protein